MRVSLISYTKEPEKIVANGTREKIAEKVWQIVEKIVQYS